MDFQWLRGANPAPRYLGFGRKAGHLYPLLAYMTGLRNSVERLALMLPARCLSTSRSIPAEVEELLSEAIEERGMPHAALLLYTGRYKETLFVGPVALGEDGPVVFWKAFRSQPARAGELERIASLRAVIPPTGRIAEAKPLAGRLMEYENLQRVRRGASPRELVHFAVQLGEYSVRGRHLRPAEVVEPSYDKSVLGEFARLRGVHAPHYLPSLVEHLERVAEGSLYLSHGDLTPWNVFPTLGSALAVIDYDAVGYRPAMYDVVHLLSQPAVERGAAPPLKLLRDLLGSEDVASCLLWDVYETMAQYVQNPDNRGRTGRAAMLKADAWRCIAEDVR